MKKKRKNILTDSSEVEAALEDIRKSWVSSTDLNTFSSHRSLAKYWRELKLMVATMRDYTNNGEENNSKVVKAVYDYIVCALTKYLDCIIV